MDIKSKVREYLLENITFGDEVEDNQSLFGSGVMDSTGAMSLIEFLEDTFDIEVDDMEVDPDNIDSVAIIVGFVESKLKEAA